MTKPEIRIKTEIRMAKGDADKSRYDLEERTAQFGEAVIALAKRVPVNDLTRALISQLVTLR